MIRGRKVKDLATRFGDGIDAAWRAIGLDLYAYSLRHPARATEIGIWCLAAGQTIGYACFYYIFASLLLIVPAIAEEAETKTSKPSLTYYFYDG